MERTLIDKKKLSDWNYKIWFKPGKTIVVNRMKKFHDPYNRWEQLFS